MQCLRLSTKTYLCTYADMYICNTCAQHSCLTIDKQQNAAIDMQKMRQYKTSDTEGCSKATSSSPSINFGDSSPEMKRFATRDVSSAARCQRLFTVGHHADLHQTGPRKGSSAVPGVWGVTGEGLWIMTG